nr:hypothetical protein HmN_000670400 [Hymenolepis microstoma]
MLSQVGVMVEGSSYEEVEGILRVNAEKEGRNSSDSAREVLQNPELGKLKYFLSLLSFVKFRVQQIDVCHYESIEPLQSGFEETRMFSEVCSSISRIMKMQVLFAGGVAEVLKVPSKGT